MRGFAALFVVFQHARQLAFVSSSSLPSGATLGGFLLAFTNQGLLAVNSFFVLSGFLIGSSIRNASEKGRWSWTGYWEARLTRLMVPLVPALLLTAFWDQLGLRLPSTEATYVLAFSPFNSWTHDGSSTTFFGNLAFLQGIRVPTFGTDDPLWSLAPEFWYYAIYPFLFFAFTRDQPKLRRLAFVVVATVLLIFVRENLVLHFPQWLSGVAVAFLPRREWAAKAWFRGVLAADFVAIFVSGWLWPLPWPRVLDEWMAASVALLIWSILCRPSMPPPEPYRRVAAYLSDISYTLYLVHFPLLTFAAAVYFGNDPHWYMTPLGYATLFVLVAACVLYGTLVWYLFERNTGRIRAWLKRAWPTRPATVKT